MVINYCSARKPFIFGLKVVQNGITKAKKSMNLYYNYSPSHSFFPNSTSSDMIKGFRVVFLGSKKVFLGGFYAGE